MGRVQTTNTDLYSFDSWFPVGRGSGSNSGSFLFASSVSRRRFASHSGVQPRRRTSYSTRTQLRA